jgi:hypothetical protein
MNRDRAFIRVTFRKVIEIENVAKSHGEHNTPGE